MINLPSTLSFPAATMGRTPAALIWLMAALTAADLPPPRLMFITALPVRLPFWAAVATVMLCTCKYLVFLCGDEE